jgi:diguanylate cyclase (GGDEF)-like protein
MMLAAAAILACLEPEMPYALLRRTVERFTDTALLDGRLVSVYASIGWIVIAVADWMTTYELSLNPFYVIVFCLVTWHSGWRAGLVFVLLSFANQVAIGVVLGHPYSRPTYFLVTNFNKLFSACLLVALVARLKLVHERERTHARVDYLTGALNNMGFFEALSVELARHRREAAPFAVAYLDCDDFKSVNDRLGHRAGDMLLSLIVDTLTRALRKTDVVARLGGDEFAVLLPKTGMAAAQNVVQQVLDSLNMAAAAQDFTVTFSVGVVVFDETPETEDVVLSSADRLMYRAKSEGKNRVVYESASTPAWNTAAPAQSAYG